MDVGSLLDVIRKMKVDIVYYGFFRGSGLRRDITAQTKAHAQTYTAHYLARNERDAFHIDPFLSPGLAISF